MSKFIRNLRYMNQSVTARGEVLKFDNKGIAEVQSDALYEDLKQLNGYGDVEDENASNNSNSGEEPENITPGQSEEGKEENSEDDNNENDEEDNSEEEDREETGNEQEPAGYENAALTREQLDALTIKQLQHHAKVNGIDLTGKSKKDEIIDVIINAQVK